MALTALSTSSRCERVSSRASSRGGTGSGRIQSFPSPSAGPIRDGASRRSRRRHGRSVHRLCRRQVGRRFDRRSLDPLRLRSRGRDLQLGSRGNPGGPALLGRAAGLLILHVERPLPLGARWHQVDLRRRQPGRREVRAHLDEKEQRVNRDADRDGPPRPPSRTGKPELRPSRQRRPLVRIRALVPVARLPR